MQLSLYSLVLFMWARRSQTWCLQYFFNSSRDCSVRTAGTNKGVQLYFGYVVQLLSWFTGFKRHVMRLISHCFAAS
jgi:hypothetical protein